MLCGNFEGFLPVGDTHPFMVRCEDGHLWVVKAHGNPLGTKAIFNEYVAGELAKAINLPWPTVSIVELAPNVMTTLRQKELQMLSNWAVGIKYVAELKKVNWPSNGDTCREDFPQLNSKHINNLFPDPKSHFVFYGKAVFDNWLILRDTKYDTLFIQSDGYPIFLDASIALGGLQWDVDKLEWRDTNIDFANSPYLMGILSDPAQFEPWVSRVEAITKAFIDEMLLHLPKEWSIPSDYIKACGKFLKSTKESFIPQIRAHLDWEEFMSRWANR